MVFKDVDRTFNRYLVNQKSHMQREQFVPGRKTGLNISELAMMSAPNESHMHIDRRIRTAMWT